MNESRKILWEALLVAVIGILFAFTANRLSPRGLALTRDYFPGATRRPAQAVAVTHLTNITAGTNAPVISSATPLAARLKARGLQLVDSNLVTRLFRDPKYALELVVFIDARNDRDYQEGHVPGAYQLDHYHLENYLGAVLPACQTAEQIVVYCNGGDCEDSEFTAITLSDAGIPKANLRVYDGGMKEWTALGLPVETGQRKSGNLRPTTGK